MRHRSCPPIHYSRNVSPLCFVPNPHIDVSLHNLLYFQEYVELQIIKEIKEIFTGNGTFDLKVNVCHCCHDIS